MLKKIILIFILSIICISCWYENEYYGAVIHPNIDEDNYTLTLTKRMKDKNNIMMLNYTFKDLSSLQPALTIDTNITFINSTNIFDNDFYVSRSLTKNEANQYMNIKIDIATNKYITIKDWNNEEHILKYTTNTNSWVYNLYVLITAYGALIISTNMD
ncbi:unclassified [Brachyspira pilosicoli WesB]|uniref:Unclassified n=1 Tax=Brachyspira pilosicoli WesB TaxID=1161918 RepID=K0JLQ2_BRAPL|nr:hypothetical protein [Brachyspira pilosicoli]CCG57994.1 unclassified [Brachyspira pilosicoli WesB]